MNEEGKGRRGEAGRRRKSQREEEDWGAGKKGSPRGKEGTEEEGGRAKGANGMREEGGDQGRCRQGEGGTWREGLRGMG